ncbi:unnamed protein product [Lactuca virosa]|uniref:Uncharacterized protein n=1 Tax=Lactuca virosa TaxID=75947 RepID=A0AAU9NNQ2_9ASTR|nr:unnamed protein product [Lactuca virosa]
MSFSPLFFLLHQIDFNLDHFQTMSQKTFSNNGGFRETDLDIPPTEYELLAMETQVELEQMGQQLQEEMRAMRTDLREMRNVLKAIVAIGMTLVSGVVYGVFGCGGFGLGWM